MKIALILCIQATVILSLDFYARTNKISLPRTIDHRLVVKFNLIPIENFNLAELSSTLNLFIDNVAATNPHFISLREHIKLYFSAIVTFVNNRKSVFTLTSKEIANTCSVNYEIVKQNEIDAFKSQVTYLSTLLPNKSAVDVPSLQNAYAILLQLSSLLKHLTFLLTQEDDDLKLFLNNNIPDQTIPIIQSAPCFQPDLAENLTITRVTPTSTGLSIDFHVIQYKETTVLNALIATPLLNQKLNLTNVYLYQENLVTLQCPTNTLTSTCLTIPFNTKCVKALRERFIYPILHYCPFIEDSTSIPTFTPNGILVPAGSTIVPPPPNIELPVRKPLLLLTEVDVIINLDHRKFSFSKNALTTSTDVFYVNDKDQEIFENYFRPLAFYETFLFQTFLCILIPLILLSPLVYCVFFKPTNIKNKPSHKPVVFQLGTPRHL